MIEERKIRIGLTPGLSSAALRDSNGFLLMPQPNQSNHSNQVLHATAAPGPTHFTTTTHHHPPPPPSPSPLPLPSPRLFSAASVCVLALSAQMLWCGVQMASAGASGSGAAAAAPASASAPTSAAASSAAASASASASSSSASGSGSGSGSSATSGGGGGGASASASSGGGGGGASKAGGGGSGGGSDFSSMVESPDEVRRAAEAAQPAAVRAKQDEERLYNSYLRRARDEELKDMQQKNFIYYSGNDSIGRPVICIIGQNFPADHKDMVWRVAWRGVACNANAVLRCAAVRCCAQDRVLLYIIKVLDPLVQFDYNLVYFHTNFAGHPSPVTPYPSPLTRPPTAASLSLRCDCRQQQTCLRLAEQNILDFRPEIQEEYETAVCGAPNRLGATGHLVRLTLRQEKILEENEICVQSMHCIACPVLCCAVLCGAVRCCTLLSH